MAYIEVSTLFGPRWINTAYIVEIGRATGTESDPDEVRTTLALRNGARVVVRHEDPDTIKNRVLAADATERAAR